MRTDETVLASELEMDDLNQLYMELGKAYYEGAFEDPLPQLLPLFDKITKITKKSETGKEKERVHMCPFCGDILEEDAVFCGNCGRKIN